MLWIVNMSLAFKIISVEEGFSAVPYRDHLKYPTIGWGRLLSKDTKSPLPSITTTKEAERPWVDKRIQEITLSLSSRFPLAWGKCNDVRKAVLISCAYQLGVAGLSAFKNMWTAIEKQDWTEASKQMLDSLAARQTPNRWKRNASMMSSGIQDTYYK